VLLARDPAAHVALDDPDGVARLLDSLRQADAHEQAAALAARAAAHAPLDNPYSVVRLLDSLREAGAAEQTDTLLARDPAAHALLDDNSHLMVRLLDSLWAGGRTRASRRASRPAAGGWHVRALSQSKGSGGRPTMERPRAIAS
jgi:hypothetical protein